MNFQEQVDLEHCMYLNAKHRSADPPIILANFYTVIHLDDGDFVYHLREQAISFRHGPASPEVSSQWLT